MGFSPILYAAKAPEDCRLPDLSFKTDGNRYPQPGLRAAEEESP